MSEEERVRLEQENKHLTDLYNQALKDYDEVLKENRELKDNWNKLKEYLEETFDILAPNIMVIRDKIKELELED